MNAIVLLFLIGIILLAFEVFVPGAVLGILGGLAMLGGCVIAFQSYGTAAGVATTLTAMVLIGAMLWVEFFLLPRTKFGRKFFLDHSVNVTSQPPVADAAIIGRTCEAATALVPSGFVVLDGHRYDAWCQSGHAAKGAALRVVDLDNFRLIVTKT